MQRLLVSVTLLAVCSTLLSCGLGTRTPLPERQVKSLLLVPADKVVIVGRIELTPPIQESEQDVRSPRGEGMKKVFVLYAGDRLLDLQAQKPADYKGSFMTSLGSEFYLALARDRTLFISGGMFCTSFEPRVRADYQVLSAPLQINLRTDDSAVYIGTIQIHRGPNNEVLSVLIRDDYQWAEGLFKETFGSSRTLRKALAVHANPAQ